MIPITIDDLITEVRDGLDEQNVEDVSDVRILRALNRGARNCYNIIAKKFDQLFMAQTSFTTDGTDSIDIPSDAYSRRIEFLTYVVSNEDIKLTKVAPQKLHLYTTNATTTSYPSVYTTRGNQVVLAPTPVSGVSGTINYMRKPSALVVSGGKILSNTTTAVTVDAVGSDIGTDVDDLSAFVNIVDRSTGLRKATLQVSSISGTTVTFKTASLDRSTVYGITVDTAIPSTVTAEDYICSVGGTCILELISDHSDYLTQFAIVTIKRALRLPNQEDYAELKNVEKHITSIWAGRESDLRVTNKNPHWKRR